MKTPPSLLLFAVCTGLLLTAGCQSPSATPASTATTAGGPTDPTGNATPTAYLFGWGSVPADTAEPRGGSSRGAPVTLAAPRALPLPSIAAAPSAFERDRAAILSLAGDYKVSFHFLETLGLFPAHEIDRPYHSWATEKVHVLEDRDGFISLQHTLVMFFANDDGTLSEPMLVKHWRQDWIYQPTELHTFRGDRTWARRSVARAESAGAWAQTVWQVDDSPRYAATGRWTHDGNRSLWTGENAWRPLPRREYSTRDDYGVMEGFHRIVLTPTGWFHEQNNWKRATGESAPTAAYRAHEIGLDRYERITSPVLAAADDYWEKTGAYWAEVRAAWRDVYAKHDHFSLRSEVDGERLFEAHFDYAGRLEGGETYDPATATNHAQTTIGKFLVHGGDSTGTGY